MNIIGHKNIFISISGLLVLSSIVVILIWGLKLGIDFTGGSLLEVEFLNSRPSNAELSEALKSLGFSSLIQPAGERGIILRLGQISEEEHQAIIQALKKFGEVRERRFDAIGPTIGAELKRRAFMALGLAIAAIILYIAWAFRHVSKPVSSWKYGVVAVIALIHDVLIPTGVFAVLGKLYGVEVDALFITALLTILGFSVHDTIVVFDRIRENLRKIKAVEPFEITVNRSINETISRSINTSLTALFALIAVLFFGGITTRYLALALSLGIIFGTYSSIFVASPLLVVWNNWTNKR
jgi:preprotein translocase subunit SecF